MSWQRACSVIREVSMTVGEWLREQPNVGEESITDWLLWTIRKKLPFVRYEKFSKGREGRETGADWEWWFLTDEISLGLRVQAKRLRPGSNHYGGIARSNQFGFQIDMLMDAADSENLLPFYCFYHPVDADADVGCPGAAAGGVSPPTTILMASAEVIYDDIVAAGRPRGRKLDADALVMRSHPLACFFCCPFSSADNAVEGLYEYLRFYYPIHQKSVDGMPRARSVEESSRPEGRGLHRKPPARILRILESEQGQNHLSTKRAGPDDPGAVLIFDGRGERHVGEELPEEACKWSSSCVHLSEMWARDSWSARSKTYQSLPETVGDPLRSLDLLERLRCRTRNGNDLFFIEQTMRDIGRQWPEHAGAVDELLAHFFNHIPEPPAELFHWIETPLDGQVDLWRKIPAGKGWVGSPVGEEGRYNDEGPRHRVELVRPYWLGSVPVTNAQYAAFDPKKAPYEWPSVATERLATHPRVNVTWYEAVSFCRWLSTLPEFAGCAPRLPIEEEWEVACRAGSETRFWKGDDDKDLDTVGWYDKNSGGRTHRVGNKPANEVGLYDVHGNAWEWTSSPWQADRYADRQGKVHPVDPADWPADLAESPRAGRVIRGGSCRVSALWCRSAYRVAWNPGVEIWVLGFRVLLSSAPSGL